MSPVECAMAFGGVEIGNSIASEQVTATVTISVAAPPIPSKPGVPAIPVATAARIGMSRAEAAEWEMKFESA